MNLTDKDKELLARLKTPLAPRKGDWDLAAALIERLSSNCEELQRDVDYAGKKILHLTMKGLT